MRILALDTALDACSVAIIDVEAGGFEVVAAQSVPMIRGHAEALLPMIAEMMGRARLKFSDIQRIGVTVGPGTFTGTRIGIAAARGLALANRIDASGVATLHAVAFNARDGEPGVPIAVFFDAHRDEVYGQLFSCDLVPIGPPQVMTIADAAAILPLGPVAVVGSGAHLVAAACTHDRLSLPEVNILPDPAAVGVLAAGSGLAALPIYLRPPDAKPQAIAVIRAG